MTFYKNHASETFAKAFIVWLLCDFFSIVHAQQVAPIEAIYSDQKPFIAAIEKEHAPRKNTVSITGIGVPHHINAADLIARGFWAASNNSYDRIVILTPDHFNKTKHPFATTQRDFQTPFGVLRNDVSATNFLLRNSKLLEENDLFNSEHGTATILPFVRFFFPEARIVPIAISANSSVTEWDAAVELLAEIVNPKTLVIQSTDYSHYLTHDVSISRDQETLNVISAGKAEAITKLLQPDHLDSKAAQYIQMKLQAQKNHSSPIVIGNRNSTEYGAERTRTTSYIVTVYGSTEIGSNLRYDDQRIVYFAGDTFLGRWLTQPLNNPTIAKLLIDKIQAVTGGLPLILNLEGVLLDNAPEGLDHSLHVMHSTLALPFLKNLNVLAVGLANNHSHDLGANGYRETVAIARRAGITPLEHMRPVDLGFGTVVSINFIRSQQTVRSHPVIKASSDLQRLCWMKARPPVIAFVHWGEEYRNTMKPAQYEAANILRKCGIAAIIGAHSHLASSQIESIGGGEYQITHSLGNLLFDQRGDRVSTAILELRVFKQGTISSRLIKTQNLFELATRPRAN